MTVCGKKMMGMETPTQGAARGAKSEGAIALLFESCRVGTRTRQIQESEPSGGLCASARPSLSNLESGRHCVART